MADTLTPIERSKRMALVRSSGNKRTELRLIEQMRLIGLKGWRRNQNIFGRPDFVWRKERLAVFVDGCFWHCCPKHTRIPKSRREFWVPKLARNQNRDRIVNRNLRKSGWTVIRFWECEIGTGKVERKLRKLGALLESTHARLPMLR
jgi:DNA mismatch endonuclease (patch repair protein)